MTVLAILDLKETAGFVLVCVISLVGSLFNGNGFFNTLIPRVLPLTSKTVWRYTEYNL